MATRHSDSRHFSKTLESHEVSQRVIRIEARATIFPDPGVPFDLWHEGTPWASRIRRESCFCGRPPGAHSHRYLDGGELHAGLRWEVGSELIFELVEGERIEVSGDLSG